jgi:hypothetical protein
MKKYGDMFLTIGTGGKTQLPVINSTFKDWVPKKQAVSFNEDALMFIDEVSKNEDNQLSSCVNGYQSRSNIHESGDFDDLLERTKQLLENTKLLKKFSMKCIRMWFTICGKDSEVKPHRHDGHISGIYYLQSPDITEAGELVFETGQNFKTKSGDLFLFESRFGHFTRQNMTERTKVSLNFDLILN